MMPKNGSNNKQLILIRRRWDAKAVTLIRRVGDDIVLPEHSRHVLPHQNPQMIRPVIPPAWS